MPKQTEPLNVSLRTHSGLVLQAVGPSQSSRVPESQDDVALLKEVAWSGVMVPGMPKAGSEQRGGELVLAVGGGRGLLSL